ncbi:MAG: hypothetical protein ACK5E4_14395, partial [Planctomycetia bacterium]
MMNISNLNYVSKKWNSLKDSSGIPGGAKSLNLFNSLARIFMFLSLISVSIILCLVSTISSKGNGYLVPITIQNYADQSIRGFGYLGESLDGFLKSTGVQTFPNLIDPLQTENEIRQFFDKRDRSGENLTVLFLIESRALPSQDGDVIILPSDYGTNYSVNGILLSELLCKIMEFPGKNKVVLIDIMRPWSSVSHGGLFWDLGADAEKVIEIAKTKFLKRNGFSANNGNFWTWWAAGRGEYSRTIGSGNSFFKDQISKALDNYNDSNLKRLKGFETFKNLTETVQKNVNVQSNFFMGSNQNPFLIGWGKDPHLLPSHFSKPQINQNQKFYWPKEYINAWEAFFKLKNNQGYLKNPRLMYDILTTLIRFQYLWIISQFEPKILENLKNDTNHLFKQMDDFQNKFIKVSWPQSMDDYSRKFSVNSEKKQPLRKKLEKFIFKPKESSQAQDGGGLKEMISSLAKEDSFILELVMMDCLLDVENLTDVEIRKASELIKNHHLEYLFPESLAFERILKANKRFPGKLNASILKTVLSANVAGFSALSRQFKNDMLYNANLNAMQNLFQAEWLLENGENVSIQKIENLYKASEKINLQVMAACENFESIIELYEKNLVEISALVNGNFVNAEWISALLEPLEKIGGFLRVQEDNIDVENYFSITSKTAGEIETEIKSFIKELENLKTEFVFKRHNLISFLNETVIS